MSIVERYAFIFLLAADAGAIIVSMVAGPLSYETIAVSAALSACIISLALVIYGLYFWRRKER